MRILFICEYFPTSSNIDVHGGVELRTFYIAKYLAQKHQVFVLTSNVNRCFSKQTISGINIFRIGLDRSYSRTKEVFSRFIFILSAIWKGYFIEFDLVEGSGFLGWFPAWTLGVLKNKRKVALVADISDFYLTNINPIIKKTIQILESYLLLLNWDKIVCISNDVRVKILKKNVKNELIQVIYCGVDLNLIKQLPSYKAKPFNIICVSRLVPYKRVIDLIKAIRYLKKYLPEITCNIIGTGEEYNNLTQYISKNNLTTSIYMKGYIKNHSEILAYIKKSYVFCLPSIVEGFGISTIESLGCGVPVVLSDISINREITHGMGVLFFNPLNYIDLANKIAEVFSNKQLYKILKKDGKRLSEKYKWSISVHNTQRLYENLCTN